MMSPLLSIVTEATKRGIPCETVWDSEKNQLGFSVPGFSKCGNVLLFATTNDVEDDVVLVKQRYSREDEISDFSDLVSIAWGWFVDYKDRSPFENPSSYWKDSFVEKGYIQEVQVTSTKYVIK